MLISLVIILMVACVSIVIYMWKQANENNIQTHEILAIGEREPLRLFFISDTHARKINKKMIQSINQQMDAVIIGGDFVDRRTTETTLLNNTQLLKSLGPVYFVWGNNDCEYGEQKLRKLFAQQGITILENESVAIGKQHDLFLSAIVYKKDEVNIDKALQNSELDKTIFIAHNPEQFRKVLKNDAPLLMIGGHLHGGQIRLGSWGIQPHGYFKRIGKRYELVSNGYGTTFLPLRLGARPECHVITVQFISHSLCNEQIKTKFI